MSRRLEVGAAARATVNESDLHIRARSPDGSPTERSPALLSPNPLCFQTRLHSVRGHLTRTETCSDHSRPLRLESGHCRPCSYA